MAGRILIIRGGAIGDFVLTLPAIRVIRETLPDTHIEILGYQHIVALAENRFYADKTRSIEYGPLAGFFVENGKLDKELVEYFADFHQIISYLYDPDGIFQRNLRRCWVRHLITANPKVSDSEYAAVQLARPLERLALFAEKIHPEIFPSEQDQKEAQELLDSTGPGSAGKRWIALHPGSGSPRKNWPVERWIAVIGRLLKEFPDHALLLLGGEADEAQLAEFERLDHLADRLVIRRNLPLPLVGAVLQKIDLFLGHDSGISHIAAAAGARCVLLYGPTSATTWGPQSANVTLICSEQPDMKEIATEKVISVATEVLS